MAVDGQDGGQRSSAPPVQPAVEALSTGRARRAMAGSRMRELIEQERERILAEGGDDEDEDEDAEVQAAEEPTTTKPKGKRKAGGEEGDEDAIFRNDANDVDFEARDDADDIIDSDFDLSSDQGSEDEEEGERALEAEEKAAKKASRAKAVPAHMKRVVAPVGVSAVAAPTAEASSKPARQTKRISFTTEDGGVQAQQRSSKRKATMDVTLSVQARAKADEERRARQSRAARPKRKKVRISQADFIAEALEMEEQNRESLKRFLQGEEERRERDRKASKREIQGPFLRWRSVTVDRHGSQRQHMIETVEAGEGEVSGASKPLTLDPVFAARKAALKEKQAKQQTTAHTNETQESTPAHSRMTTASDGSMPSIAIESGEEDKKDVPAEVDTTAAKTAEVTSGADRPAASGELSVNTEASGSNTALDLRGEERADDNRNMTMDYSDKVNHKADALSAPTKPAAPPPPEWEARAYVSLHEVPTSTPWPTVYAHILGSHVDWSRYTVVAARNRPLRPRQSVCPITGLPAKYRDPRSGIAFANRDAYASLTQVMQGSFRWSGEGAATADDSHDDGPAKASQHRQQKQRGPRYDPLQMGCYLDRIDEPGANDVLLLAGNPTMATTSTTTATTGSTAGRSSDRSTVASRMHVEYVPRNALAPGDEQALVAAALALPAGSTRSGTRRTATK